ncbi:TRAP transporter, DctM subunit [Marinospirillum celere]|uniref:TRAP transporter large permease protein n=1 Tax=Marinospirillum celere TaxID=1122252 RepID=A0A1I1FP59_9GAMM|nr:TRAP transporter large permease [Marinospirillum celere]SFC01104.1 TRAP transporter, DctM subunit [Marinospirillum celere]
MIESLIGFFVLFILILLRIPLAFAMGAVGFIGFYFVLGGNWNAAEAMAARRIVDTGLQYSLTVIPLFVLMGNLVTKAGMSAAIYRASNAFIGHYRGGQAMATILACGGFSSISGSSLATAATMSKVAMPQMRKYGYSDSLATASIAAGGTLGILIPPSVMLVIYGILAEQSIRELFAAGLLPGILGILLYLVAIQFVVRRHKDSCTESEKADWKERFSALAGVGTTLALFLLVIGGIYIGMFTPTEAAGMGAFGAFLLALSRRALNFQVLKEVLVDTTRTTAMLFAVIIAAMIFSNFINRAGLPNELLAMIHGWDLSPMMVLMAILLIYLLLGCMLESMSMLLLTVPLFFPIMAGLGFDLVWFGILVVIVIEISLITPPVGMNVFVLKGLLPEVSTATIFKGIFPFWVADVVRMFLVVFIPGLALWLPNFFY